MPISNRSNAALVATLAAALCACGGSGGGGGDASPAPSTTESTSTPMSSLVVPASMTWSTAAAAAVNISVLDADGLPAAGAAVSLSTQSTVSPHDAQPLRHAVAMELVDSAVTDASGIARFDTRLPAHVDAVLVVVTRGDQSGRRSASRDDLSQPLSIQMSR
jgi:hypothetical protein